MKTVFILTGHMRSFEKCLPTLHWHIARHFPEAAWFVSTIDDANAHKAELLKAKYPSALVCIDAVKEQPDCVAEKRAEGCDLPASWSRGEPYTFEPYPISVHPQAVLRQLWQLEQGWKLYQAAGLDADCVIRVRPDLYFHSAELREACDDVPAWRAFTPWWGRFGGINDRFAVLGKQAAHSYFTAYSRLRYLMAEGCPLHPESLLRAALDLDACLINDLLPVEFSTLRENGQMRAPEVAHGDLARWL